MGPSHAIAVVLLWPLAALRDLESERLELEEGRFGHSSEVVLSPFGNENSFSNQMFLYTCAILCA